MFDGSVGKPIVAHHALVVRSKSNLLDTYPEASKHGAHFGSFFFLV